jgi:enoyl-CoA hydratase
VHDTSDILFERRGCAGIVTLNRPKALNAVTHAMVQALALQLDAWGRDAAVTRVILRAEGERAFSAGGDVRALYELGTAGRYEEALAFWRDEYILNAAIRNYRKPYISLIDGVVMGGGVGISVNGALRIAGDRFQFAMPEVGIGFFPDVGATFILPRMPGELGTWCALTGDRLKAADGVSSGIATHRVASAHFAELTEALSGSAPVEAILSAFVARPEPSQIARAAIDRLFTGARVEDVLAALDVAAQGGEDAEFARATAANIRAKSPTSLKVALAQVRRGKAWSFAQCIRTEFRIVSRIVRGHDFYEGVRAVIVDKDNAPRWRPETLAAVSDADIDRYFAPIVDELSL